MDASTISVVVIGVPVLAYHIYVGYLTERANLSGGGKGFAAVLLGSIPLVGAVVVHIYLLAIEEENKKVTEIQTHGNKPEVK